MAELSRRSMLKLGVLGGIAGSAATAAGGSYLPELNPTPSEIKGPFYPIVAQKDKDFDLTKINGKDEAAKGTVIMIQGTVLDTDGNPVPDATVDLWQANAEGRYNHPHDRNDAPLDPNFQGWAVVPSGEKGGFRFKTIFPGVYPAAKDWMRPPHIHYKVSQRGYIELITQMYFPGHELKDKDLLLQHKGKKEQKLMIATEFDTEPTTYKYNIVLQEA